MITNNPTRHLSIPFTQENISGPWAGVLSGVGHYKHLGQGGQSTISSHAEAIFLVLASTKHKANRVIVIFK
jgi:hypothetical protein